MKWLIILLFVYLADGRVVRDVQCPLEPVAQTDVDVDKLKGTWYSWENKEENIFDEVFTCYMDEIKSWDKKKFEGKASFGNKTDGISVSLPYTATLDNDKGDASYTFRFSIFGIPITRTSRIVATDYDNYMITWTCDPDEGKHDIGIETRTSKLTDDVYKKITKVLQSKNIDTSYITEVRQNYC